MTESTQLTRAALKNMTPRQIVEAKKAGRLDAILRGETGDVDDAGTRPEQMTRDDLADDAGTRPKQMTRDDLAGLTPAEIHQARREGRLNDLLAGSDQTYT